MPKISGMAHIQLCVSDMDKSMPFYSVLLKAMGMKPVIEDKSYLYCIGGKTAVAISPVSSDQRDSTFQQGSVGLHHICFRARSTEDVDELYAVALELSAKIVREPEEGNYAPGYYSTLFEDPDGMRIEINYVPGKGLLGAK